MVIAIVYALMVFFLNIFLSQCRGMSNNFWGWGREDDELYLRFKENKLTVSESDW